MYVANPKTIIHNRLTNQNIVYVIFFQPIAYMVEMKEQLDVTDVKGNKIGVMNVEIAPCNDKGREYTEADDMFVDSPEDLVKKNVNFVFKILKYNVFDTIM